MLILILVAAVSLPCMVVGDLLDYKFHRKRLGAIIGFTGFGLACLMVIGAIVFILI